MATQDQLVTLRFEGGVDSKPAEEAVIPTKLISLVNGEFYRDGEIAKRGAFDLIEATAFGAVKMMGKRGNELLVQTGTAMYRRQIDAAAAVPVTVDPNLIPGYLVPSGFKQAAMDVKQVSATSSQQTNGDFAVLTDAAGRTVVGAVWEAGGLLRYQITYDDADTVVLAGPFTAAATTTHTKGHVIAVGTKLFFYYVRTYATTFTEVYVSIWDSAAPTTMGSASVLAFASGDTLTAYDVNVDGTTIAMGYKSGTERLLLSLSPADGKTFLTKSVIGSGGNAEYICAVAMASDAKVAMFWRGTPNVDLSIFGSVVGSSAGVTASGVLNVLSVSAGTFLNRITAFAPAGKNKIYLAYDVDVSNIAFPVTTFGSTHPNIDVRGVIINLTTFLVTSSDLVLVRGACLATDFNDAAFVGVAMGNDNTAIVGLDDLYLLPLTSSQPFPPYLIARMALGDSPVSGNYSPPLITFDGKYYGAFYRYPPGLTSQAQFTRFTLDFSYRMNSVESQGLVYMAGACPYVYDGKYIAEEGFTQLPVNDAAIAGSSGGVLGDGTYGLCYTYEWYDGQGNLHRSAPSIASSISLSGGGSAQTISLIGRYLRQTWKAGVKLVLYRTTNRGGLYYRDSEYTNNINLLTPTPEAVMAPTLTDTQLTAQAQLYAQPLGGVLENWPMPACKYLVEHQRRLVGVGLEQAGGIFVTFLPFDGFPPTYNPDVQFDLTPNDWGANVAAASIDDKLIILAEQCIGYVYGEGPNTQGQGATYSKPAALAHKMGLPKGNQLSVTTSPDGVWFGSSIGLRLITRGLSVGVGNVGEDAREMGSEVDSLITGSYVGAIYLRDQHQAMFFTPTRVLVYDDFWKQWSMYTSQFCLSVGSGAVELNGRMVYTNSGDLYRMSLDSGGDDGGTTPVPVSWKTAFIRFDQLAGFVRAKRVQVLYRNATVITFNTYVDYSTGSIAESQHQISVSDNDNARFFEHHITNQKCRSIAFGCSEATAAGTSFGGLTLLLGMKKGIRKLSSANRMVPSGN